MTRAPRGVGPHEARTEHTRFLPTRLGRGERERGGTITSTIDGKIMAKSQRTVKHLAFFRRAGLYSRRLLIVLVSPSFSKEKMHYRRIPYVDGGDEIS